VCRRGYETDAEEYPHVAYGYRLAPFKESAASQLGLWDAARWIGRDGTTFAKA